MMRKNAVAAVLFSSVMLFGMMPAMIVAQAPDALPALPDLPALPAAPAPADAAPAAPAPDQTAVPPDALPPAPAPLPGAPAAAAPLPGVLPTPVPFAAPAAPGVAAAVDALPGALPSAPAAPGQAVAAVPTPPPLDQISLPGASSQAGGASSAAAPSQLYTFLFVELPDYGIVRHPFNADVAENLKNQELARLRQNRRAPQPGAGLIGLAEAGLVGGEMGLGMPVQQNPAASAAAAEWDFYYNQLEMYDKFVREKLIPGAKDLPELAYDAANALQERQDLFESFQQASIEQSTQEYNANKQFYERLAQREDRRRSYLEWLELSQQEVEDWAEVWARKVYGTRWADGEEVRLDDWYYGKDFNSANPVLVAINNREYVVSRQPVERLQDGQLNVISSNLTPYDIIDANGEMKNPVMETLRGTIVLPPAPPDYGRIAPPAGVPTAPPAGTIEIVGGVTTE